MDLDLFLSSVRNTGKKPVKALFPCIFSYLCANLTNNIRNNQKAFLALQLKIAICPLYSHLDILCVVLVRRRDWRRSAHVKWPLTSLGQESRRVDGQKTQIRTRTKRTSSISEFKFKGKAQLSGMR
jgi:hypothetical protein